MPLEPTGTAAVTLAAQILNRVEEVLLDADDKTNPLEVDPFRGQLFELFVTAEGAGYLDGESACDLSADGLCRQLAERWGLREATSVSIEQQSRLSKRHLKKMRLLWSVMRMWMEWTYAWQRWPEFHNGDSES